MNWMIQDSESGVNDLQLIDAANNNSIIYSRFNGTNAVNKLRTNNFFAFLLFEKGSGTHTINFIDYEVKPLQLHVLFPGQAHKWRLGSDTVGQKLVITKDLFEKFTPTLQFAIAWSDYRQVIDLNTETYTRINTEFSLIHKELSSQLVSLDVVSLRAGIIATLANRQKEKFKNNHLPQSNSPLLKFYSLIELHFRKHRSVSFYAEQLGITPNYLSILCKKNFDTTPLSLISERVILEAKIQIHAGKTVKEITFELGFKSISYFSFFFKEKTGFSPRQYKSCM